MPENSLFRQLASELDGDLYTDRSHLFLYATDASIYRELPEAVVLPATTDDLKKVIKFAKADKMTLIPRGAGTSLAGQVVGKGIVVDISRYFNKIIEINADEKWVRVETGVVLDELNLQLFRHGLFFAPETSTSNRCMIGGMVGNNSCGSHSLIYGSTRDHLIAVKALLSDGSEAEFGPLTDDEFMAKTRIDSLEGRIYRSVFDMLSIKENQDSIIDEYPDPMVKRRNTGYAIDSLLQMKPFNKEGRPFNLSALIAGSEGTLAFVTEVTLNLVPLPPPGKGLLCIHLNTLEEALEANLVCLRHNPGAVELMDSTILECTKSNIEQRKNRFFVKGDPGAILIAEFTGKDDNETALKAKALENELTEMNLGYYFPLVTGNDINKVWALRKSGLGVLSNIPGDARPVSVIEDTAVRPDLLPGYIADLKKLLSAHGLSCVFHAHIGTGELHFRPMINLKDSGGVTLMRTLAIEMANLVKKYRGSLSGEHGDGRVRSELIPIIIGQKNYDLLRQIKKTWDPSGVFNRGKITDPTPMTESLRYVSSDKKTRFRNIFNYAPASDMLAHVEMCNGSGDCRKSALMGGTMCPSYMASGDEYKTTRGRANLLREYLIGRNSGTGPNAREVYDILDNCLSCKGCKAECPSNVDMAKLKAEFLQHYYDIRGIPLQTWLVARMPEIYRIGAKFPSVFNFLVKNTATGNLIRSFMGFSQSRAIPEVATKSLRYWINDYCKKNINGHSGFSAKAANGNTKRSVYLFLDEFSNYTDAMTGIAAVDLLLKLGYNVLTLKHSESGRTSISKGLIRRARKIAENNVRIFSGKVTPEMPLIGIEPSSILSLRDEYPELVSDKLKQKAKNLADCCLTLDEFIATEYDAGNIDRELFTTESRHVLYHGHCQQKAVATTSTVIKMLSVPENYKVEEIKSGCCGMAGSFGYEKRHYDLSMKIGELALFPAVRNADADTIICASGTSCRQQILDGTKRKALHPAEVLYKALNNKDIS